LRGLEADGSKIKIRLEEIMYEVVKWILLSQNIV